MGLPSSNSKEPAYINTLQKFLKAGKRNNVVISLVSATKTEGRDGFQVLLTRQEPNFLAASNKSTLQQYQQGITSARASNL
jgi:hypothetical protein